MKTWLIAASAIGGIYAPGMILLDAAISKKNIGVDGMPEYIEKGNALFYLEISQRNQHINMTEKITMLEFVKHLE